MGKFLNQILVGLAVSLLTPVLATVVIPNLLPALWRSVGRMAEWPWAPYVSGGLVILGLLIGVFALGAVADYAEKAGLDKTARATWAQALALLLPGYILLIGFMLAVGWNP